MSRETTTDYTDRLVDLEFLQSADPERRVQLQFTLAHNGVSRGVTGLQKAIQRYSRWLLDSYGSNRFHPEIGTNLLPRLLGGQATSRSAIVQQFVAANLHVMQQLAVEDIDSVFGPPPADERVAQVSLTDYAVDYNTGTLRLVLRLETDAGELAPFTIPIERL